MKRLIIAICTLLFFTDLWAHRGVIELTKDKHRNCTRRSISIIPSVYQDGNTIYIYSNLPLENLQITIKDETGQVISEEIIFLSPQQPYTYSIGNAEDGTYFLELNDGEEEYYGSFNIRMR